MTQFKVTAFLLINALLVASVQCETYKMCVSHLIYDACVDLMKSPGPNGVQIECVKARDRMDCLDLIVRRQADFMAVDPEDMYVAYKMNNQDFSVFSEIRTLAEPTAEFRYEGIMLVHKNANIKSLPDLAGKKACYTGFGRNVGYKIPITKLTKAGVLKLPTDNLHAVEKELKAFSEFFAKGCLVGKYSPDAEINQVLKKRYSNLCELCEDPVKCDYPDKYSGYEGAIRCLVENNGDVAFTKVIFVNKYFGLPVGNSSVAETEAQASADDYEYLCEDGTRRPLRGPACSWAARPWQGYMGNEDVKARMAKLQARLITFYEAGKNHADKEVAKKMLVNEKNLVVTKEEAVLPEEHLSKSKYLDVIERSTARSDVTKFCVDSNEGLDKCRVLKMAAFSRDIRPVFECHLASREQCAKEVSEGTMNVTVLGGSDYLVGQKHHLKPILFETYNELDKMVAIADKDTDSKLLRKATVTYDATNHRALDAALLYNEKKGVHTCPAEMASAAEGTVRIVHVRDLPQYKNKELVCPDFTQKPFADFRTCHFDIGLPKAVFVKNGLDMNDLDNIIHGFTRISESFGHNGNLEEVFELFGQFAEGRNDVLFDDRAEHIEQRVNEIQNDDVAHYLKLYCLSE